MSTITVAAERLLGKRASNYTVENGWMTANATEVRQVARYAIAAEATERRLVEENDMLRRELTIAEGVESNLVDDNDRLRAALAAAQAGTVVKEDFRPNEWPGSGSAPWPTLQEAGADDR